MCSRYTLRMLLGHKQCKKLSDMKTIRVSNLDSVGNEHLQKAIATGKVN